MLDEVTALFPDGADEEEDERPRVAVVGKQMRSLVTPGVSLTIAIRSPASMLKSVDFPTFGRPTMATIGLLTSSSYRCFLSWRRMQNRMSETRLCTMRLHRQRK